jgi:hypothetical protein
MFNQLVVCFEGLDMGARLDKCTPWRRMAHMYFSQQIELNDIKNLKRANLSKGRGAKSPV